jgi:RNA polymerase sigma-70 factor (ECF subfamily)
LNLAPAAMTSDSERDILRECASSDPDIRERAFEALYRRHAERAYRLAYRLTGHDAEARDVVQEAFLRVFRRIRRFRRESAFSSWLHRITVNIAIDHHRRRQRRPETSLQAETTIAAPSPRGTAAPTPVEDAVRHERAVDVRRLVADLSPPLAAAVLLRYGEGLSYEEIAASLDVPVGTVKSRLNRAHDLLAPRLRHLQNPG